MGQLWSGHYRFLAAFLALNSELATDGCLPERYLADLGDIVGDSPLTQADLIEHALTHRNIEMVPGQSSWRLTPKGLDAAEQLPGWLQKNDPAFLGFVEQLVEQHTEERKAAAPEAKHRGRRTIESEGVHYQLSGTEVELLRLLKHSGAIWPHALPRQVLAGGGGANLNQTKARALVDLADGGLLGHAVAIADHAGLWGLLSAGEKVHYAIEDDDPSLAPVAEVGELTAQRRLVSAFDMVPTAIEPIPGVRLHRMQGRLLGWLAEQQGVTLADVSSFDPRGASTVLKDLNLLSDDRLIQRQPTKPTRGKPGVSRPWPEGRRRRPSFGRVGRHCWISRQMPRSHQVVVPPW